MKLVFLGPAGSGKGTYASRIAPKLEIPHIATGDLLREEIEKKTSIGIKAEEYVKKGLLVPDRLIFVLFKKRLAKPDTLNGFILEGFPRNLVQAKELDKIAKVDLVINLVVPEKVCILRLSSRVICRKCAKIYNLRTLKPKKEGVCDVCGGELYQREDETPEAIRTRLHIQWKQSEPVIEYYRKKKILADVACNDADAPLEIMVEKIMNLIKKAS